MRDLYKYSAADRNAVYQAIFQRRDIRHFTSHPVAKDVLQRIAQAAHAAPSVGFMQPWRIIQVKKAQTRQRLHDLVEAERLRTADALEAHAKEFMRLKVQGILECSDVWVVCLMDQRERHVFGRRTLPHMDLASASCAIQNIWLAARAEGVGMGWVSIFEPDELANLLNLPEGAEPIAILCIGHVEAFDDKPLLEREGWAQRGDINDYMMQDAWDEDKNQRAQAQWNRREKAE
ncbi:MAG: 5,6-dimethylbenzimidazole synthase [Pontibacterium sp.]